MSLSNFLKLSLKNYRNVIIGMIHRSQMKEWRFQLSNLTSLFRSTVLSTVPFLEALIKQKYLMKNIPQLKNFTIFEKYFIPKLMNYYKQYVSQVSNENMAISLRSSIFLIFIIFVFRPKSVLDLGSGFSSFVIRYYLKVSKQSFSVWSIDDSSKWLEKTYNFLNTHNLKTGNLINWDAFAEINRDAFDFIFYDLGNMQFRKQNLIEILNLAHPGSIFIFDDVHKTEYRKYAKKLLKKFRFRYYNLKYLTEDSLGRYFMLAIKQ